MRHYPSIYSRSGLKECYQRNVFSFGKQKEGPVFLLAYVDDILLVGKNALVKLAKNKISSRFTVTDLGTCTYSLGINIEATKDGLFLSQSSYTQQLIQKAHMEMAKPTKAPLPLGHPLYDELNTLSDDEKLQMVNVPYHELVGGLIYLATRTRPDISTAVSMLGKFVSNPAPKNWKALKCTMRYLVGTKNYGIKIVKAKDNINLMSWCDADWARDKSNRRSRSGYILKLNDSPIVWSSKLQTATALSSSEAEFAALSSCTKELIWIQNVLGELGFEVKTPTAVYQDNLGAISWTSAFTGLRRVKHIALKFHHVKEAVANRLISVEYIPSTENKADSLTKALVGQTFLQHREWLGCFNQQT